MKKILIILILSILLLGFVHAKSDSVEIDNVTFKIPPKYQGGEFKYGYYRLDNKFSIRCVDDNIPKAIGLWTAEQDFGEDISVGKHPVRHFYQYNTYVEGNDSHAYFASGKSVYEISWVGEKIDKDIKQLIKSTPPSKISNDDFYDLLDVSYEIYKLERQMQDEYDAQYNYMEAKYNEQLKQTKIDQQHDNRMKELWITYINKMG
ncbi:MAG: hypothetical protein IKH85_07650 [Methanobrevibacter sp.]|uniref:hypothetical protein n=1 Tax=Methanobrevibacter sp. TaxID=66852 RepID=UPI0025F29492|nr:hypothetical protein [Methanobrevibacter sp.]MBR6993933.1 hypothetical protein [Methanobrevibacter sp.]